MGKRTLMPRRSSDVWKLLSAPCPNGFTAALGVCQLSRFPRHFCNSHGRCGIKTNAPEPESGMVSP